MRNNGVTHDFLRPSFALFAAISEVERRNDWPGARLIVAAGFRARGSRRGIDAAASHVDRILERMTAAEISPEEAVREAASIQRFSDGIPQLQANFAFTRAYVADAGGSRAGLGGPRMFVDTALFADGQLPGWIQGGPSVPFHEARLGLECAFAPVDAMKAPGRSDDDRIPGLRDGLEIGEAIAPTLSLREMIKSARHMP